MFFSNYKQTVEGFCTPFLGHCEKLMLILAKVHARMQEDHDVQWAFVADDDTLLRFSSYDI